MSEQITDSEVDIEEILRKSRESDEKPENKIRLQADQLRYAHNEIAELKRSLRATTWVAFVFFLLMMYSFGGERREITEYWERLDSAMEKLDTNDPDGWAELDQLREDMEPPPPEPEDPY